MKERSKEGREKLVKIFPPCERARGVIFGGPEVVIFPPAGRLASRRASDPPPGGAWRDVGEGGLGADPLRELGFRLCTVDGSTSGAPFLFRLQSFPRPPEKSSFFSKPF